MAKKKAAKKTNRKAVTRKKSAAKKTSRKTVRKAAKKSRKPAARAKTKSARPKKAVKTTRATSGKAKATPPVPYTVTVPDCDIQPQRQHFSDGDYVFFNCSAACILDFSDPSVLGLNGFAQQMQQGNNRFQVAVPSGSTTVSISGCETRGIGPADIIVP